LVRRGSAGSSPPEGSAAARYSRAPFLLHPAIECGG